MKYEVGDLVFIKDPKQLGGIDLALINDVNVRSDRGSFDYQGLSKSTQSIVLFNESVIVDYPSIPTYSVFMFRDYHNKLLELIDET